ncbi:uncharacterized protein LOC116591903 isoform X6 [Mustela erminea]|uniref:uncharacterized protein LOC116591903 isoform X6 n=1 Tax=Mustela erminea TaxID=36723 RepID=UPI001386E9C5|nr:uncharacterized protein LOC116591903 isoform X6 [Mustela erminea]
MRPLVSSHWVFATACPWEAWALLAPGLPAGVGAPGWAVAASPLRVLAHVHEPPPSTENHAAGQPCPRHTGWAGRRPRWKRPEQPPEDRRSVPGSPLSCLSPVPCLSTCTRVGLKTPSGILHGRRDLHAPPSTLRRSNPSAATGTPCTRSRGTGRTQRLWTRATPCEEGQALLASPCVATRPLTDGLH